MKRFIVLHESRNYADGWLLWLAFLLGGLVLALVLATTAAAGTAYCSFTGWFVDGTETQSFLFDIDRGLPRTAPFSLRTWHYNGVSAPPGNAAGDPVAAGGFDPQLWLYDDAPALVAWNDDGPTGLDSLINWATPGMPESLDGGAYRLDLVAYNDTLGGRDGHWAVDLEADATKFILTGVDKVDGTGATTIGFLSMGSDDSRVPAKLQLGPLEQLSVVNRLDVGNSGAAEIVVSTGSLSALATVIGTDVGSYGSVTVKLGGSIVGTLADVGGSGEGELRVESGGFALFGLVELGSNYDALGTGTLTVTGYNSVATVNGDLLVGHVGTGYLYVQDQGWLNSSGTGSYGETVGWSITGHGTAEVDGLHSLWQTDKLTVGYFGQGTVRVSNGGRIDSSSNAYIGATNDGHDSSVTLTGAAPDGTPSTWQVSGNLYIAGTESGASNAANSKLTINPGGLVDVADATFVWNNGGIMELLGGELETGSFSVRPGATFAHEDGTLTVDGFTFDPGVANYKIDGADATDLPVVKLTNGAMASISTGSRFVAVGDDRRGRLEILTGSQVVLPHTSYPGFGVHIGQSGGSGGEVLVDGQGSQLTTPEGLFVGVYGRGVLQIMGGGLVAANSSQRIGDSNGSVGIVEVSGTAPFGTPSTLSAPLLEVGRQGHGTMTISAGAFVDTRIGAMIAEYPTASGSSVTVTGLNSRWAITGPLYVGGSDTSAGGAGTLTFANYGQVTADSVKVWQPGTVAINNGTLSTGSLELAGGKLRGSGIVNVSGQLTNSGVVAPGLSVGFITVDGNYLQDLAGELAIEIGGSAPSDYDRLNIENGSALLHGKLAVSLIDTGGGTNVFQPNAGDIFEILTVANGLGGTTFATEVLPALRGGLYFGVLYNPTDVTLVAAGVLGDYNRNGAVDAADYVVWRKTFSGPNVPASSLAADGDGDGDVDGNDHAVWRAQFGQTAGSGAAADATDASDAIPEPATLVLLGWATILFLIRRRTTKEK